jgi:hypothetical protein
MIPTQEDPKTFSETEEQIGEYRVGTPLGEGQFATVKNCYLKNEDKEYALKIINKDRITSFTALMRVSTEIDNLKQLKNPYIVSVTRVIHTETKLYIITEKGGRDLFEFFDEHPDGVPEDWAKQIIACVLKGVMFCHDQGICHRGKAQHRCALFLRHFQLFLRDKISTPVDHQFTRPYHIVFCRSEAGEHPRLLRPQLRQVPGPEAVRLRPQHQI